LHIAENGTNALMGRALFATAALAAGVAASADAAERRGCAEVSLVSTKVAYAAYVRMEATASRAPDRRSFARFRGRNANGYPTLFSVLGRACGWYHVQLPLHPNGVTGYVRAGEVTLASVRTRIVVDLSARLLTFFRAGRAVRRITVGIGSPLTPTPIGRFYVNQRLIPRYKAGPWGPAALGVSAFSPTLHSWTQGGPVAIHGTNAPSSIGRAASHGCLRVRNALMLKLYGATPAGTPVLIRR
jgi:lipoprotein-anchoring transpeptidase ErfK/SrfK